MRQKRNERVSPRARASDRSGRLRLSSVSLRDDVALEVLLRQRCQRAVLLQFGERGIDLRLQRLVALAQSEARAFAERRRIFQRLADHGEARARRLAQETVL